MKYACRILMVTMVFSFSALYGQEKAQKSTSATAIFGGGCFWCLEADFDKVKGVVKTVSGYDGGVQKNPTYEYVSSGKSQYVEVVQVTYDPKVVTYQELLTYYFKHIDPTDSKGQFCDKGDQYKSAIFYLSEKQKGLAQKSLENVKTLLGLNKVHTQILSSTHFYPAERYHQNFYKKNPLRYKYYRWSCGRDQKVREVWDDKKLH